jgi:N-glycosidase YbiA
MGISGKAIFGEYMTNSIYFYSTRDLPYGVFSNFARFGIEMNGLYYRTTEHYFQAMKFVTTAPDYAEQIRKAATPKQAATMGRSRDYPLRPDWEAVKDGVMYDAVLQKFRTHDDIRALLLATRDAPIVEAAPTDAYWGTGPNGGGLNKLGQILMQVREVLRVEAY